MPTITSYSTLVQAITDYTHRSDLAANADYFIQGATEQIQEDIPDLNFGNFIRPMEVAYGPALASGGTTPVPTDWLGAKLFTIGDGAGDTWTLIFKSASWLYTTYPQRVAEGLPAYVARDVMPAASFTASVTTGGTILNVTAVASGTVTPGAIIAGAGLPTTITGAITITGQNSGTTGGIGLYALANPNNITVASEPITSGGNVFVFGPYPDSAYSVAGTYYGTIPLLTSGAPTNWVITLAPTLMLAACMVEAAHFIADDALLTRWTNKYEEKLKALVDMDKAERWSAGTMAIEIA